MKLEIFADSHRFPLNTNFIFMFKSKKKKKNPKGDTENRFEKGLSGFGFYDKKNGDCSEVFPERFPFELAICQL